MAEPNAEVRNAVIPIAVILNAAAVLNVEVRIAAPNAATQNVVTQSASGDFLNEGVPIVVQGVARVAVLQSVVPPFAAPRSVVSRCVPFAVTLCVATLDAMVVLQNDSLMDPPFGVQDVVLAGHCRLAGDAVQSAADVRVPDVSHFSVPVLVWEPLRVVQ